MAIRVSDAEVRAIIPNTTIADLTPFIVTASLKVDKVTLSPCGSDFDAATLKEGEKWLAAHYASLTDGSLNKKSESFEGYSVTFSRASGENGVLATQYGQTANDILGGCLEETNQKKVFVCAVGGDLD